MRTTVRIALTVLALALLGGVAWFLLTRPSAGVLAGKPAPATLGTDADGIAFQLSDYRGKVVMLDFWGDW